MMGSDGLFDNVFDHEIVSTITQYSDVAEAGTFSSDPTHLWNFSHFCCNTAAYFSP